MLTQLGVYRFRLANTEFVVSISGKDSTPSCFQINQPAEAIAAFPRLREILRFRKVLQLSGEDTGSVALTSLVGAPALLVAVSTHEGSTAAVAEFAQRRGVEDQFRFHEGVPLEDPRRIASIVDAEFGAAGPEVVVDDASDRLPTGRRAFETLFPRLRTGGSYVFLRWSWDHIFMTALPDPESESAKTWQQVKAANGGVLEAIVPNLVEAAQLRPDIVAGVTANKYWIEVRRGPTRVDPTGFRLPDPL